MYKNVKPVVGVEVRLHLFWISALDGGERSVNFPSLPGRFTHGSVLKESWLDPRISLDLLKTREVSFHFR
jgi:hypothetical protein